MTKRGDAWTEGANPRPIVPPDDVRDGIMRAVAAAQLQVHRDEARLERMKRRVRELAFVVSASRQRVREVTRELHEHERKAGR